MIVIASTDDHENGQRHDEHLERQPHESAEQRIVACPPRDPIDRALCRDHDDEREQEDECYPQQRAEEPHGTRDDIVPHAGHPDRDKPERLLPVTDGDFVDLAAHLCAAGLIHSPAD